MSIDTIRDMHNMGHDNTTILQKLEYHAVRLPL